LVHEAPINLAMQSAARSAPVIPEPPNAALRALLASRHCPPYTRTVTTWAYSWRTTESSRDTGTVGEM
jgi:hypothetical protein